MITDHFAKKNEPMVDKVLERNSSDCILLDITCIIQQKGIL